MHRKKPFSIKQKKAQLQAKRAQKRDQDDGDNSDLEAGSSRHRNRGNSTNTAPSDEKRNRLTSKFDKLTREEIERNKKLSMQPLHRLEPQDGLTMSFEDAYSEAVDIPIRPAWKYGETRATLENREARYFDAWLEAIQKLKDDGDVSLYEKNLEVWRQLWRVVEISDILLVVIDIRHPVLHFPPSLYRYVTKTTGKPLVVVLNKTDLVTDDTVQAWKSYFKSKFSSIVLTSFCCYREKIMPNATDAMDPKLIKKKTRKRVYDSSQVGELFAACRNVVDSSKQSLVEWDALIARYTDNSQAAHDGSDEEVDDDDKDESGSDNDDNDDATKSATDSTEVSTNADGHVETVSDKYVTIGLIGHPNVGKSTVINSIMGRTVVSTSRTPGHTKHFQTIHVTPTLRLCDCPGLVFPCVIDRTMQILAGLYNIAQVQEPYSSVQYLAERIPLEKMLNLLPKNTSAMVKNEWSAWGICEAFAVDRGFYTSKAARPDVYRAALHILRWELDGRVLLSFKPPGFFRDFLHQGNNANDISGGGRNAVKEDTGLVAAEDPHDMRSQHNKSDSSSDEEDNGRPIAQQSAFALLEEESC
ncbi:hypothetical protein LPJ73_000018 [Coemansia sp. RSA 2703]|nr:hypothetical protein LPJ73_000018 [Coemansia sp. RSA 2703]KAJ2378293.1 hypothetical protein IW150_000888 [Coemansia sp. RSA 2607]KAJ2398527.1 hypothetical protein GGI05_000017 [Coemansia sp. RSA 2603]